MNASSYLIKRAMGGFGANLGTSLETLRMLASQEQAKRKERKLLRRRSYTAQLHDLEHGLSHGRPSNPGGYDQRLAIPA